MKKKGFTLAELTLVIAVIGVVAAITFPALRSDVSKYITEKMFEKAFNLTSKTVADIVSDTNLYSEEGDNGKYYLDNTSEVSVSGENYQGDTKFCELFASQLNILSAVNCTKQEFKPEVKPVGTFTLADKSVWILPITDFSTEPQVVSVDFNGDKRPNCYEGEEACKNKVPDRMNFYVYNKGLVVSKLDDAGIKGGTTNTTPVSILNPLDSDACKQAIADMKLRETNCKGVYCELHNPNKPAGDYSDQRHYVWNANTGKMELIDDIAYIGGSGREAGNNANVNAYVNGYNFTDAQGIFEKDGNYFEYDQQKGDFEPADLSKLENSDSSSDVPSKDTRAN